MRPAAPPPPGFGLARSGRVALRLHVPGRGQVTILTVEPGDIYGWSAIVPPYRSTSTGAGGGPRRARAARWRGRRPGGGLVVISATEAPAHGPGFLARKDLGALFALVRDDGRRLIGPTVRDGAGRA